MDVLLAVLQAATLVLILALVYRPLGDYMAHIYTSTKDWRVERGLYRLVGVDPRSEQSWPAYLRGVLAFSVVGVLFVYVLQRAQAVLPYSLGLPAVPEGLSFNTAASFVTNTNWQSYSPELTMGYTVQLAGLAVQNFVSAAVGIAVAVALVRGFARRRSGTIGNFWVDLFRGSFRLLLPIAVVGAIILIVGRRGAELQRLHRDHDTRRQHAEPSRRACGFAGGHQGARHERRRVLQRELRAPVREPDRLDESLRDRAPARDPVRAPAHLRQDGRQQQAGLRDPRRHGDARRHLDRHAQRSRAERRGHRARARGRGDGGQGAAVRHPHLHAVRRVARPSRRPVP